MPVIKAISFFTVSFSSSVISCRANALTSGNTKSCGCLRFVNKPYKHKAAGTKAHNSWRAMKGRCYDENNIQYKDYGGRGIKMDDCFREDF